MGAINRLRRDKEARVKALEVYERITELPLLILALAIVPLIVVPFAFDLNSTIDDAFLATDWLIWAIFAIDLTVRTYLSEHRRQYLISHWYDVLIVVIPFLRPLRILRSARALRLLRLTRAVSFSVRFLIVARTLGQRHGLAYVMVVGIFLLFAAAILVFVFERNQGGPIDDFSTALWWAVVTITTVGYGDAFPVTNEGRGIAIFLMVVGISLFGFLTASIAAFLVEQDQASKTTLDDVMSKLESLEHEVHALRQEVTNDGPS